MEEVVVIALVAIVAILMAALAGVRAVAAVRLLEKDPEAWEKWQHNEDMKRRQRQENLGKAALNTARFIVWILKRNKGGKG
jgi:hypothetical protein